MIDTATPHTADMYTHTYHEGEGEKVASDGKANGSALRYTECEQPSGAFSYTRTPGETGGKHTFRGDVLGTQAGNAARNHQMNTQGRMKNKTKTEYAPTPNTRTHSVVILVVPPC